MIKCSKCKIEKNVEEFGIDKSRKSGRNLRCKSCCNEYANKNYQYKPLSSEQKERRKLWESEHRKKNSANNAEKCRAWYQRNLEHARKLSLEATKKYLSTEKGKKKRNERSCNWEKNNPEKRRVHDRTMYAVKIGKLIRPSFCSCCGKECKPQAHHEDYSKPYDVIWLCSHCHFRLHHSHKHYRERTSEKTPKGDAMFRTLEETQRDTQK